MEVGRKTENENARLNFEETELRLGLPSGGGDVLVKNTINGNGKRGFEETTSVDLKLKLSSMETTGIDQTGKAKLSSKENNNFLPCSNDPPKPPAKAQVVGWPPVRSFRKNRVQVAVQKSSVEVEVEAEVAEREKVSSGAAAFVKVSMDGAPYLRKVDLKLYNTYQDLSRALANMFSSFTLGNYGSQGKKDFMNVSKLMDLLSGSDNVLPTYQDKDGDWMLVGDVPWEMFVNSCKRLRIMKGTEAIGIAPRAMEKCKNRS